MSTIDAVLHRDSFLIGGEWRSPEGDGVLDVVSPMTEEAFGGVPLSTPGDIDAAVAAARRAFEDGPWPRMTVAERGEYLLRMEEHLRGRLDEAVHLQIDEMGGPHGFVSATTGYVVNYVAHLISAFSAIKTREVRDRGIKVVVTRQPVGVVAVILPWNGPLPLAVSLMLPPLLSGCSVVLKPAPETPLSAYLLAEAALEAGLPDGVLNIVPGNRDVGEHLVSHPGVDRVSFTGSSAAGRRVAALCGEGLKRATLELGGKSAAIVLPDADLDRDMGTIVGSAMPNNGQVCFATTRLLVPRDRSKEFVDRMIGVVGAMKVGDPHDPATAFGPLVAERQRDRVENYIKIGREEGATVALGGGRPAGLSTGWYVEPTIFTNVDNSMRIAQEEIFGPVVCVIDYETEDDAVAIANESAYGLGGAVFTSDVQHGLEIAARIETGTCGINEAPPAGGGGPFGGVKQSGVGREHDLEGYDNNYEIKSIALPPGFAPDV